MAGTIKRLAGPAFIANAAANLFNQGSALIYTIVRHIHIANKTAGAVTFSLYVGATGASASGTELYKDVSIPANGTLDYYPVMRMDSTDFLTGVASAASSLVITIDGEQMVV